MIVGFNLCEWKCKSQYFTWAFGYDLLCLSYSFNPIYEKYDMGLDFEPVKTNKQINK